MPRKPHLFWLAIVLLFLSITPCTAGVIPGVTVHDVSSELPAFLRTANQLVDGSGLTGNMHTTQPNRTSWLHNPSIDTTKPDGSGAVVTFDLGANYDVIQMNVWNYNETQSPLGPDSLTMRGAKDVEILFSTSLSNSFISAGTHFFPMATGLSNYTGSAIDVALANARLVRFNILTRHHPNPFHNGGFIGLSEVQFVSGSLAAVPEPGTVGIFSVALGLVALNHWNEKRRVRLR